MWQALEVQLSIGSLTALMKHLAWSHRRFGAVEYPGTRESDVGMAAVVFPRHSSNEYDTYATAAMRANDSTP